MLEGIELRENLGALARARAKNYETKTISRNNLEAHLNDAWKIDKKNETSVRVKRDKSDDKFFEDRIWTLLYRMGILYLSSKDGANLVTGYKNSNAQSNELNIVGIDNEVAISIKCKISDNRESWPLLQEQLHTYSLLRERFALAVNKQFSTEHKRQIVFVMFLCNIVLTDEDKRRASQANIVIFDNYDLEYYENLVGHIGPAAKYQFFSDMLPGKRVPGLEIKVPAIKTKMGGSNCYTFSITPEYLLKISYISHRAKGRATDINTYQRMISKSRLSKIKKYIGENGIFPTNIVLNLEQKLVHFERTGQDINGKHDIENGILGWLTIRPAYKSAWIIDGQHRLFAYSGHEKATKSKLSILAFEGLLPSRQAQLFVDINAKQKSVKQSLLQELYAELHWDAEDANVRVRAILSKAVQDLGEDPDSPLFNRIQTADSTKDHLKCITLTSVFGALEKTGFHITKIKNGVPVEFGPLWSETNEKILKRTVYILKNWLKGIRSRAQEW